MQIHNSTLLRWWDSVSSSFWFLPVLVIVMGMGLGAGLVELDSHISAQLLASWPRLLGGSADGARALLSLVAASMITVAGVVFSITLVALSLASSQYSSRVLRSFMRNRTNQLVLGIFLGIFAYCQVVLRGVRSASDSSQSSVPSISALVALVLGVVGVFVLVIFIHHISTSIQASQILAAVYQETMVSVRRSLPDADGILPEDELATPIPAGPGWSMIRAPSTGYVTGVGIERLLRFAEEHDRVLWTVGRVGDFVVAGAPMLAVSTSTSDTSDTSDTLQAASLREAFTIEHTRTLTQDMAFGIRQLVDVALKALSPSINDSTTAVMCVDYLTAVLYFVAPRPIRSRLRTDTGTLRVVVRGATFEELLAMAFDQIRQSAAGNTAVLGRLLDSAQRLGEVSTAPGRRHALGHLVTQLEWSIDHTVPNADDRQVLRRQATHVRTGLESPEAEPMAGERE